MKITVFYSADADTNTELEVQPTDTVKSVKQKIIAVYAPPDWANTALLAPHGTKEYLENKKRLSQCSVQAGDAFKFTYARNLTSEEKLDLNMQGVQTEEFPVPDSTQINTMPPRPLPY